MPRVDLRFPDVDLVADVTQQRPRNDPPNLSPISLSRYAGISALELVKSPPHRVTAIPGAVGLEQLESSSPVHGVRHSAGERGHRELKMETPCPQLSLGRLKSSRPD